MVSGSMLNSHFGWTCERGAFKVWRLHISSLAAAEKSLRHEQRFALQQIGRGTQLAAEIRREDAQPSHLPQG